MKGRNYKEEKKQKKSACWKYLHFFVYMDRIVEVLSLINVDANMIVDFNYHEICEYVCVCGYKILCGYSTEVYSDVLVDI